MSWYELVWTCMNLNELVWTCMNLYELVWTCMNWYELVWTCMNMYELVWTCMNLYELVWTCTSRGGLKIVRANKRLYRMIQAHMSPYRLVWACMNCYELVWTSIRMIVWADTRNQCNDSSYKLAKQCINSCVYNQIHLQNHNTIYFPNSSTWDPEMSCKEPSSNTSFTSVMS